jgi:hypothetical protein
MKRRGCKSASRRLASKGTVLGHERFAKISAVEGIELSEAAKRRAARFERESVSPAQQIREIIAAYRKA